MKGGRREEGGGGGDEREKVREGSTGRVNAHEAQRWSCTESTAVNGSICIECEAALREAGNEDKGFVAMHRSGRK